MSFKCDVCDFVDGGGDASQLKCELCPYGGGALRQQRNGRWAHVSCQQYSNDVSWPLGENHNPDGEILCSRSSGCGACLKVDFNITRRKPQGGKGKAKQQQQQREMKCTAADCPDPTWGLLVVLL